MMGLIQKIVETKGRKISPREIEELAVAFTGDKKINE